MDDLCLNVLMFRWKGDIPDENEYPDPEQWTCMLSKAPLSSVCLRLKQQGYEINGPYEGDGWWEFGVQIGQEPFTVSVMWTGIGGGKDDWFVMQFFMRQGCLASIFKKKIPAERLQPAVVAVQPAVEQVQDIHDKHWLTEKAFHDYYGGGKEFDL